MKNKSQTSFGLQKVRASRFEEKEKRAKSKRKRRKKEEEKKKIKVWNPLFWIFGMNSHGDCFSFGLEFVERSHKLLICWGYESKTPIDVKETLNHQIA